MTRRQFIVGGGAAVCVFTAVWVRKKWTVSGGYGVLAAPGMLRKFLDEPALAKLGDTYLRRQPGESQPATLAALIAGQSDYRMESDSRDAGELEELLQNNVRDDFAKGRLIELDGWVLAQTEARQCALLAILPDD